MDDILNFMEDNVFTKYVYPENWLEKDDIVRQTIGLYIISVAGSMAMYFIFSTIDYVFFFDKNLKKHPKYLKNQIAKEIGSATFSLPFMGVLTVPFLLTEVRGMTKLYDTWDQFGVGYYFFSMFCFMMWNDCGVYWIHRGLHSKLLYKRLHKEHHKWLVPTPYAALAFNPIDGWAQSLPYHFFIFVMPMHKWTFIACFILVQLWTISIHDQDYLVPNSLRTIINSTAHHTDHHLFFNYNYGLYFTLWDRIGGSYRSPSPFEGRGPADDLIRLGITQDPKKAVKSGKEE